MKSTPVLPLLALLALSGSLITAAPLGTAFTYQGRLTDGGQPANGSYDLKLILYDAASGGSAVAGPLTNSPVGVTAGLFTVTLDFGDGVFTGAARWLEIAVRTNGSASGFTPLSPRQLLTPAPYALTAQNLAGSLPALYPNPISFSSPANAFVGDGSGLTSLNAGQLTTGTLSDARLSTNVARLDGSPTFSGTVSAGGDLVGERLKIGSGHSLTGLLATIAGGLNNTNGGTWTFVGGGKANTLSGQGGMVSGGEGNRVNGNYAAAAGWYNAASGNGAVVAGGANNTNQSLNAAVSGGRYNTIQTNATGATIGGGYHNQVQSNAYHAIIGGGYSNTVSAPHAAVAGGVGNLASGPGAVVAGGGYDGSSINGNTASGLGSVVGGGTQNIASGSRGAVGGGHNNSATDTYATVPGGAWNLAGGEGSFAAGRAAKSLHDGTFVWSDEWSPDFVSTASDQFLIRAAGGVGINTNAPVSTLHVNGTVTATAFAGRGASLTGIGTSALADNSVTAAKIVDGSVGTTDLANDAVTSAKIADGTVVKSLNALKDDVALVAGTNISITLTGNTLVINGPADYWSLNGNGIPLGQSYFLGTTTPEALEIRVNNWRALKLFPFENDGATGSNLVNLIAGSPANTIDGFGNTLAGGGASSYQGLAGRNWVSGKFATLSGGVGNECFGVGGTLGGGEFNRNHGDEGVTLAGGSHNFVQGRCYWTTISGGEFNLVELDTDHATIGGGQLNQIQQFSDGATVGGGLVNRVEGQARGAFLGGGENNLIQTNASGAAIVGGGGNTIGEAANHSAVGGGSGNKILAMSAWSSVGGGYGNIVGSQAGTSTIGGGYSNRIQSASTWATIAGGRLNTIQDNSPFATVLGGSFNVVRTNGQYAAVVGGLQNEAADYSLAAGRRAKAIHSGTFLWADALDADFASTRTNQFLVRAAGGVGIGTNNPQSALHVNGTVTATAFAGSGVSLTGIGTSALADNSVTAAKIVDGSVGNAELVNDAVTSGKIADGTIGAGDVAANTFWSATGNAGTTPGTHFLGTTDNRPIEIKVNGQRALRLEPNTTGAPNVIGGSPRNFAGPGVVGATIGGGGATNLYTQGFTNRIYGDFGTIGGGIDNSVQFGYYATIGGGILNSIQSYASAATIGGGWGNTIQTNAMQATISGGWANRIRTNAENATIGGGVGNAIGSDAACSTLSGGSNNTVAANARFASLGGGVRNTVSGAGAVVAGGGFDGSSVNGNTASGPGSAIIGGTQNIASGSRSAVGGGHNNSATNWYASVPGGAWNLAGGEGSLAAGRAAKALHAGTFVWSGNLVPDFASTATEQFLIRANGGVGINKNNPATALDVSGTVTATAFAGSGAGLTGLNASQLTAGTLPSAQLAGTYSSAVTFNNTGNSFSGTFSGNGAGLTSLNAGQLTSGTVPDARLAGNVARTNQVWLLGGNAGTTGAHFLGTTDNRPLEIRVIGLRALRLEPDPISPNVIGGSSDNVVGDGNYGSTIGGGGSLGYSNAVFASFATIGGGYWNTIQTGADSATISGGRENSIESYASHATIGGGNWNLIRASTGYATIGGGVYNIIEPYASRATIGGGYWNLIQTAGDSATIGGGWGNTIRRDAYRATIGGGMDNMIGTNAVSATIGGGHWNTNSGGYASIGGGLRNLASGAGAVVAGGGYDGSSTNGNTASGPGSAIVGGTQNIASGSRSAVGGGHNNSATNWYATVPGGAWNLAAGQGSLAAGRAAKAHHDGAFVWSDDSFSDLVSTNVNSVTMRASGGYRLFSNSGATVGASLAAGGNAWSPMSDRNVKENFRAVDARSILEKVIALPVTEWNLISQPEEIRHLGPMAQDFKAAFGVGESDRHISTSDADGVALAAIQGLNQKLTEELKRRDAENAELKARLEKLEHLLNGQAAKAQ